MQVVQREGGCLAGPIESVHVSEMAEELYFVAVKDVGASGIHPGIAIPSIQATALDVAWAGGVDSADVPVEFVAVIS